MKVAVKPDTEPPLLSTDAKGHWRGLRKESRWAAYSTPAGNATISLA